MNFEIADAIAFAPPSAAIEPPLVAIAAPIFAVSSAATSPIDLAKANADNATAVKLAKAEAKQATESAKPSSGKPLQGDADCATGACDPK